MIKKPAYHRGPHFEDTGDRSPTGGHRNPRDGRGGAREGRAPPRYGRGSGGRTEAVVASGTREVVGGSLRHH